MKTYPVSSANFGGLKPAKISISAESNKNIKYLYNKVRDIADKCKIPGTFYTGTPGRIELPAPTIEALDKLKKLGIAYKPIN